MVRFSSFMHRFFLWDFSSHIWSYPSYIWCTVCGWWRAYCDTVTFYTCIWRSCNLSELAVLGEGHWKAARTVRSLSGWVGRKLSPNNPSFPSRSSAPLTWERSRRNSSICMDRRQLLTIWSNFKCSFYLPSHVDTLFWMILENVFKAHTCRH